ncbi:MAG: TonB-dependent receptor [Pseudomonadota bacterium]
MKKFNTLRAYALRAVLLSGAAIAAVPSASAQDQGENRDVIVVTAQQREQSSQDVPISLQVINADFIESIAADDFRDLGAFVPGLRVSPNTSPTQPRFSVRGINTSDFGVGTDPAVGIYVDGFYAARSGAALTAFNDIERIEVLKGPQGTLFGRNSAAGAVSIVTKKPSNEFEGRLSARTGSDDRRRFEGLLNVPITDTLALRLNGLFNKADGWLTDAVTGEDYRRDDNWSTRASLRWDATENTEVLLRYVHDELDQDARPAIGIVPIPDAPAQPGVPVDPSTFISPFGAPIRNDVVVNTESRSLDEVNLTVTHDFGPVTLTSLTSWRTFETENRQDEDGTNRIDLYFDTNNVEDNEAFYQEFRFAGEVKSVNWILGASYYDETAKQRSETFTFTDTVNTFLVSVGEGAQFTLLENFIIIPNDLPATVLGHSWQEDMINEGDYKAYAIFGDAIWSVTDRLNLTLGLRYTRDEKSFQWLNGLRSSPGLDENAQILEDLGALSGLGLSADDFLFDFVFDLAGLAGVPCDNGVTVAEGVTCVLEDDWEDISPRVVVDYKLTDNILAYASYTQGYKAGGFNSVEVASRFENEDVTNYEIGFKSSFPEQGLILNVSGFTYTYDDKQSIRLVTPAGGGVPQYLVQTSDDEAWGVDVQVNWAPSDNFSLYYASQYIDATFKRRVTNDGLDLSGQPSGAEKWNIAFGAEYAFDFGEAGVLTLQGNHAFRSAGRCNDESARQGNCADYGIFELGEAENRTDIRAVWDSANTGYSLSAFVNNVFDEQYINGFSNITADNLGTPFTTITPPRIWGVELTYEF